MLIYFRQLVNFNKMQFMTFSSTCFTSITHFRQQHDGGSEIMCKFCAAYGTYIIQQIVDIAPAKFVHIWFFLVSAYNWVRLQYFHQLTVPKCAPHNIKFWHHFWLIQCKIVLENCMPLCYHVEYIAVKITAFRKLSQFFFNSRYITLA